MAHEWPVAQESMESLYMCRVGGGLECEIVVVGSLSLKNDGVGEWEIE